MERVHIGDELRPALGRDVDRLLGERPGSGYAGCERLGGAASSVFVAHAALRRAFEVRRGRDRAEQVLDVALQDIPRRLAVSLTARWRLAGTRTLSCEID